jgi:hypothetical protein
VNEIERLRIDDTPDCAPTAPEEITEKVVIVLHYM